MFSIIYNIYNIIRPAKMWAQMIFIFKYKGANIYSLQLLSKKVGTNCNSIRIKIKCSIAGYYG